MSGIRTTFCARCCTLQWIEGWQETHPDTLSIVLGPCGHIIERNAGLEWRMSGRASRLGTVSERLTSAR